MYMNNNRGVERNFFFRRSIGSLLCALCFGAPLAGLADTVHINDNGYDPGGPLTTYTLKSTRYAATDDPHNFTATNYTYTLVQPKNRGFEWSNFTRIDNLSNEGENVAVYGQGWKMGKGSTWGGVFEPRTMKARAA